CRIPEVPRCFSEGQNDARVIKALDGVLRRLGGTARRWRTHRMAGVVYSRPHVLCEAEGQSAQT
ncbi:MAG: hypothetical protein ACXVII_45220, partial [Solirubrobacteraceae bacterium]